MVPLLKKTPQCDTGTLSSQTWGGRKGHPRGPLWSWLSPSVAADGESSKMCIAWANAGFSWTSHLPLLCRLSRRSRALDPISKGKLKLFFFPLKIYFMQLELLSSGFLAGESTLCYVQAKPLPPAIIATSSRWAHHQPKLKAPPQH